MAAVKLLYKSSSFFSTKKQERLLEGFEKRFYEIILPKSMQSLDNNLMISQLNNLKKDIQIALVYHYFEDEFLEYLFNLLNFVDHYVEHVQNKTSSHAA